MEEFTRTYSIIHLDSIYTNIEEAKKRVGNDTKIMAIVKANAYGHGAVEVAGAIKDKVYGFAVATVREALTLRESGVDNPILVLGYVCKAEYESVIRNNIIFAMLTKDMAKDISECAVRIGITAKCHIKINTGMNRIGFPVNEEAIDDIAELTGYEGLDCEGIFMHFATADSADKSYAKHQFELFMDVISKLEKRGIQFKIRHCANSAAIIDLPEYKLDMVREGIILYGLKPSDEVDASMKYYPALELKTHVIFVKELGVGESISYGRTFVTDRPMRIATVAIGYADGYPRSLSNKGYVLIHGKKAKVVGRVCMDQMMIDVTDIPDVNVEDVVTVVGKDGSEEITFEEVGELSGRFNYEFVCDISERVERKYV
ncbi:MAG: alanine racemase [Butyrivibrio crossotus]|nr:alanine racemase [Butyrivibrio crossotus]